MAFRILGGQAGLIMGGAWNAPNASDLSAAWDPPGNPLGGLTELTIAFSFKPDSLALLQPRPTQDDEGDHIFHLESGYRFTNCFRIVHQGGGQIMVVLTCANGAGGNGTTRMQFSNGTAFPMTAGQWNRLVIRWRASDDSISIWNNGVDITYPPRYGTGHNGDLLVLTELPFLTNNSNQLYGPLEFGAHSGSDQPNQFGDVAEIALWGVYKSDAEAGAYGRGMGPMFMSTAGRMKYVSCTAFTPQNVSPQTGTTGRVVDEWTGEVYGSVLWTVSYDGGQSSYLQPKSGLFAQFSLAPHPTVLDHDPGPGPGPDPDPVIPPTWWNDPQHLPQRGFEQWEIEGEVGQRTGRILRVPTAQFQSIQAAMGSALYGDTIEVDHTQPQVINSSGLLPSLKTVDANTPRVPPGGRTRVTSSVPVVGSTATLTGSTAPLTALAGAPSYILITTDAVASLPTQVRRAVALPDGTTRWVLDGTPAHAGSCRVTEADFQYMAALHVPPSGMAFNANGQPFHHWAFRGIRWICAEPGDPLMEINHGGYGGYLESPNTPHHIYFHQCAWHCDSNDDGHGGRKLFNCNANYLGVFHSLWKGFHSTAGEGEMFNLPAETWGPLHIEGNRAENFNSQWWFSGGGNVFSFGVQTQDTVIRRNHVGNPTWGRLSEVNIHAQFFGLPQMTIPTANPTQVTRVSGLVFNGFGSGGPFSPSRGSTMYEPATGKARVLASTVEGGGAQTVPLTAPWPGANGSTISVTFQMPFPCCLYNSGTAGSDFTTFSDVPTATITNGSRHVTVSAALPAQVKVGHFFYLNNTWWEGGTDGQVFSGDVAPTVAGHNPRDNGYVWRTGVTKAQRRRKKIVSIAVDRLSFETDPADNGCLVLPGEPGNNGGNTACTFPYSIVCGDGLLRMASVRGKGAWEIKCAASRFLMEGNVFEFQFGAGSLHLVQQSQYRSAVGAFTCQDDIATCIIPARDFGGFDIEGWTIWAQFRGSFNAQGYPYTGAEIAYPQIWLCIDGFGGLPYGSNWVQTTQPGLGGEEQFGRARLVRKVLDPIVVGQPFRVELFPYDGQAPGSFRDVAPGTTPTPSSQTFQFRYYGVPWWTNRGFTSRYNLLLQAWSTSTLFGNEAPGEITKAKWYNFHDNVYLLAGELGINRGGVGGLGPSTLWVVPPMVASAGEVPGSGSPGVYGTYAPNLGMTTQETAYIRFSHNTFARVTSNQGGGVMMVDIGAGAPAVKGHDLEFNDNVVEYGSAPFTILGWGTGHDESDPVVLWDEPWDVSRNVFSGAFAPTTMARPTTALRIPDNAGLSIPEAIGFANHGAETNPFYAAGVDAETIDPSQVTNWALVDVYTTGTVAIAANGLDVTIESGSFPLNVQKGQFFKTQTNATLVRIASIVGGLNPAWAQHLFPGQNAMWVLNADGTISPGGPGWNFMSRPTALSGNQWVEANLTGAWLALRWSEPTGPTNGYILISDATSMGIYFNSNSETTPLATTTGLTLGALDLIRFEANGSVLTGKQNGVTRVTIDTAGAGKPLYTFGRVGAVVYGSGDLTLVKMDNFRAGNMSDGATAVVADTFPTAVTGIRLASAYPLINPAGDTGQAYAITFKGTGSDGLDPGANTSLVEQMIRGVRVMSNFVPPDPDIIPPTINITTNGGTNFGVGVGSVTITGTAADTAPGQVTFVSWTNNQGVNQQGNANGTTSWSVTIPLIAVGGAATANLLTFTAHDGGGLTAIDTITVTYTPAADAVNPVCTIDTNGGANFATGSTPLALTGHATDNVGVTSVTWANAAGGGTAGDATLTNQGAISTNWNITGIVLTAGANVITVRAHDAQGNFHDDTITVTYTSTGPIPVVTILQPNGGAPFTTNASPVVASGTCSDDVAVTSIWYRMYFGGFADTNRTSQGFLPGGTTWTTPAMPLQPGVNTLIIDAYDGPSQQTGNDGQAAMAITYQPVSPPPTIQITGPTSEPTYATNVTPIVLSGAAQDDLAVTSVTWNNAAGAGSNGVANISGTSNATWSTTPIALTVGDNIITVTAKDADNSAATKTLTVTYTVGDTTAPIVTITQPTTLTTYSTQAVSVALAGTASDLNGVTAVTWANAGGSTNGSATGATGLPGTSNWSTTPIPLVIGTNAITISATDPTPNTGTALLTVTRTAVDTTPPVCIVTTSEAPVDADTITLDGTATDNIAVAGVAWVNDRGGSGTATILTGAGTGSTTWRIPNVVLQSGVNVVTVTASDTATPPNTHADTWTVTYTPITSSQLPVTETFTHANQAGNVSADFTSVTLVGSGAWGIVGNAATLSGSGGATEAFRVTKNLGVDDYLVTATIEEFSGGGLLVVGPAARMQGDASFTYYSMILLHNAGTYKASIQRFVGGAQQQIGSEVIVTPHVGMTLGIFVLGPRIRGLFDGVAIIDQQDPLGILTGRFMGAQGVSAIGTTAKIATLAATADPGAGTGGGGFTVTIHVPGTVSPAVTVRPGRTA